MTALEEGAGLYPFTGGMTEASRKLSRDVSKVTQPVRVTGREVFLALKPKVFATHNQCEAHAQGL